MKRRSKASPQYLSPEEIEQFFRVIASVRDRALFRVGYHRGLRASELGLLDLSDYRPNVGRLFVRRLKGSHSGEYHLTQIEQQALRAWLRQRGGAPGPLFISRNHQPISRWRLDQLMKEYCELAGIPPEKAHMHALKHSCATHLSAREPDIVAIQDHLGHANIQNTMTYVQIASKRRDDFAERLQDWGAPPKKEERNQRKIERNTLSSKQIDMPERRIARLLDPRKNPPPPEPRTTKVLPEAGDRMAIAEPAPKPIDLQKVLDAVGQYAIPDVEGVRAMIQQCQAKDPDVAEDEIIEAINVRGPGIRNRQMAFGYLVPFIPKFDFAALREKRRAAADLWRQQKCA